LGGERNGLVGDTRSNPFVAINDCCWRIPSVPGTNREGQQWVDFDQFAKPSGNGRFLRSPDGWTRH
jgi:hypothetical protein